VSELRERLQSARLYLVCDAIEDPVLDAALRGGVRVVQLRMKGEVSGAAILAAAVRFRSLCAAHAALLFINDRPELVREAGADGVHLGQDDMPVARARELIGDQLLVGLSTHTPEQIRAAAGVDYIGVGPVYATPTKPGRPAVGLELVRYAAAHANVPFFAIGGINADNVNAVRDAGGERVAVVRAITEAQDPFAAALALAGRERVGAA
jgi:thiamine-phosphate pyrophosphorylase